MENFAQIVEILNCRKYIKRYYVLHYPIDEDLVMLLGEFGEIERQYFSRYSALSKDSFSIKCEDAIQVAGALADNQVLVTLIRAYEKYLPEIEQILTAWQARQA